MLSDLHAPIELSDNSITYDKLIEDLDKAYGKKVSKMASRVRFQTIQQHEGQTVDDYMAELRHAAMDCQFGDQLEPRLKDQFVVGLKSEHIKKKLLEDEDRALADIISKARALELVDREHHASRAATSSNSSTTHQVRARDSRHYQSDKSSTSN